MHCLPSTLAVALAACLICGELLAQDSYEQTKNIVYAETHGIGLVMDIFRPTGKSNGLAIVDVISGSWSSSRGKINDHKAAQFYDIFCQRGYTVFAIRPGSVSKFTGLEMLEHLHKGIAWVKSHAAQYEVDPNRLGMTGASAGAHLACLVAVSATAEQAVAAVGVFFPPTDLLDVAGDEVNQRLRMLAVGEGRQEVASEQITAALTKLSPARLVTGKEPPFLLIHGDADKVVPLKHSQKMADALRAKNVSAKLIVKAGGAHPWLTIHQEVAALADWMDEQLKPSVAETATKTESPALFTRKSDIIYHREQGFALTMETVTPNESKNGAAVVLVMSGGWFSNHEFTKPHEESKLPNIFKENATELLERGYTLFYVVHGSQPKFNIREIHAQMTQAIRYIRFHAGDFGIDPERIGITGGSAGGHLSLMQGTKGEYKNDQETGVNAASSKVQAVVAYYPPTDFVNYGASDVFFDTVVRDIQGGKNPFMQALDFVEFDAENVRLNKVVDKKRLAEHYQFVAPLYHVTEDDAPTLLLHGDADRLVPIQQSQRIAEKFEEVGVPHKLYRKAGGNHGWPSSPSEADMIADWFDLYLAP